MYLQLIQEFREYRKNRKMYSLKERKNIKKSFDKQFNEIEKREVGSSTYLE